MADKPYQGSSEQRLVDLINSDNNTNLVLGVDYTFGELSEYSDAAGRNTQIVLLPLPPSGHKKEQTVFYRRLPIDVLADLPSEMVEAVPVNIPFTIHEVLPEINNKLGLALTEEEVVDATYDTGHARYPLVISAGSKAWLGGSSYAFEVVIVSGDQIPIEEKIATRALNGLNWSTAA